MIKYALLGANNVDKNIDIEIYPSLKKAQENMQSEYECVKDNKNNGIDEADIDDISATIFTSDNDLFYWQIKEIEV